MPPFVLSALALIARAGAGLRGGLLGTPTRAALTGAAVGSVLPGLGIPGVDLFPEEKNKRRRRRRALTASDRADIGFITGLLGPTAGKNFAITIATRSS